MSTENFYAYTEGKNIERLRLGNMVVHYGEPNRRKRPCMYIHQQHLDNDRTDFENDRYLLTTPLENCAYAITKSHSTRIGVNIEPFFGLGGGHDGQYIAAVRSGSMEKSELKSEKQDEMLEALFKNPMAYIWLQAFVATAWQFRSRAKRFFLKPKVWVLTGRITATDAEFSQLRTRAPNGYAKFLVPAGPVAGGLDSNHMASIGSETQFRIPGKCVWACQWTQLAFDLERDTSSTASNSPVLIRIRSTDRFAAGSTRSSKQEEPVYGVLGLKDVKAAPNFPEDDSETELVKDTEFDMSDELWTDFGIKFDRTLMELEAEHEDEPGCAKTASPKAEVSNELDTVLQRRDTADVEQQAHKDMSV